LICTDQSVSLKNMGIKLKNVPKLSGMKCSQIVLLLICQNFEQFGKCCTWYYIKTRGFLSFFGRKRALYVVVVQKERKGCLLKRTYFQRYILC